MTRRRVAAILRVFFLLLAAAQTAYSQSPPFCDVKHFGATGGGIALDTGSIDKAIDACATAGGGTVYLPAGTYLSGTIRLKSNVTLWLDSGAKLLGSKDLAQYRTAVDGQVWYDALIMAKGIRDVAIVGRGVIDGNRVSNPKGEERIRGPHTVLFFDCQNITVRDVTIQDSGNYSLILRSCENVNVDGLAVHGGWDGINMHDTKNATITNCRLFTGDDGLAGRYWENVTVSNCILNSAANAIRVGGHNVLIANSVIYGPGESEHGTSLRHRTEAGFQILPNGDGASNKYVPPGPVDNMVLSNLTMINVGTPFYVAYSSDAPYSGGNLGVGRIIVNGLTVLGAGKTPLYVSAPTNNPAKSIILNNVRMTFAGDADEAASQGQGYSPFSILQSYGLYARNVEDLELHDVRVDFSKTDLRPALFGENIGVLDLDRFQSERAAGGSPSIQAAGIKHLVMDGKEVPVTQVRVVDLETPDGTVTAGQPFRLVAKIQNAGDAGLASLTLRLGKENMPRSIWLDPGESAKVTFINLKPPISGDVELQAGQLTKHLQILSKPEEQAVNAPFRTFHNITADFRKVGRNFYIRAAGDYPVMQYADQYGAIYLQQSLPRTGTVIVKLQNPDLATNWLGRAGIMVRNDISKPGQPGAYVVLGSSPAAGSYLEWATDGSGQLNKHTEFEGHTLWPHWLKLERQGSKFTGYSSSNGVQWIRVGEADVPAAKDMLDAGMFVFRTGAQFEDFTIKK